MFVPTQRALNAYANISIETGVQAADPHKLILMLYEGAQLALADAKLHMARREIAAKGNSLSKAIAIIDNGLKSSLDAKAGGELSARLAALYDYMSERLLFANLHNKPDVIDEVNGLLGDLRGAWEAIRPPLDRRCADRRQGSHADEATSPSQYAAAASSGGMYGRA
jgi:flagellar protein FliS